MPEETTPASTEVKQDADATIAAPAKPAPDLSLPGGEKMLSIIGYVGFLCILPLVVKPKSEVCQHHGKQALAITLLFFLASTVVFNFGVIFGSNALLKFSVIIHAAWAAVAILGIMGAAAGKQNTIPFFGTMAKRFNW